MAPMRYAVPHLHQRTEQVPGQARGPNQREENIVEFTQHWGMSFISVSIFAEFCDQKYGGCVSVREQTINYNCALPHASCTD